MNEQLIKDYYGKFCEDKRLISRHGIVEFTTTLKYILDYAKEGDKILDVGAGTGRYSLALFEQGFDVTAVELVNNNLGVLKAKNPKIKAYQGNALNLSRFEDKSFNVVLLLGPMYHVHTLEEKVKILLEAKRVLKDDGFIFVGYCMNDYSVISYAFKEKNIKSCIENNRLDETYHIITTDEDLYDYVRIEDIDKFNKEANLERVKIVTPDGPTDYLRPLLNQMSEEDFESFIQYHLATCERMDMMGAAAHTLDILKK